MSDKTKKYKRIVVDSSDLRAEQILEGLREAALSGDRGRVATAALLSDLRKIFFGNQLDFNAFKKSVIPSGGATSLRSDPKLIDIQDQSQKALLEWLKDSAKKLSPSEQKQLMKYIDHVENGGQIEVDAVQSFLKLLERNRSPRSLKPTQAIWNAIHGQKDEAIDAYLRSTKLKGVTFTNGEQVTLYDIFKGNIRKDVNVGHGVDINNELNGALKGLQPLLGNKLRWQAYQDIARKWVLGLKVGGGVVGLGVAGLAVSNMSSPSEKDKEQIRTNIPSTIYDTQPPSSNQQSQTQNTQTSPSGGITNGNIGNTHSRTPEFQRVIKKYYTNQADLLPDHSSKSSDLSSDSPSNYDLTEKPNPVSDGPSEMHRLNGVKGFIRVAADESNLFSMVASSNVPSLDAVLKTLQTFIDQGKLDEATKFLQSLYIQYSGLAQSFQNAAEGDNAR